MTFVSAHQPVHSLSAEASATCRRHRAPTLFSEASEIPGKAGKTYSRRAGQGLAPTHGGPSRRGTHVSLAGASLKLGRTSGGSGIMRRCCPRVDWRGRMTIRRVVPNILTPDPAASRSFFADFLGFDVAMDLGWVMTYASPANPTAQISGFPWRCAHWGADAPLSHHRGRRR